MGQGGGPVSKSLVTEAWQPQVNPQISLWIEETDL